MYDELKDICGEGRDIPNEYTSDVLSLIEAYKMEKGSVDEWQGLAARRATRMTELMNEMDRLKAENEVARMRIKELDLLFGRYILAMRAAVIEENAEKGMEWIYNSLAGPGELPPEDETDAQAYFDREIIDVEKGMDEVLAFHDARRKDKEPPSEA